MELGTSRLSDNGYTGRKGPLNGKVGKGLYKPVSGSGLETTFGTKRLLSKLLCDLCSALCWLCRQCQNKFMEKALIRGWKSSLFSGRLESDHRIVVAKCFAFQLSNVERQLWHRDLPSSF